MEKTTSSNVALLDPDKKFFMIDETRFIIQSGSSWCATDSTTAACEMGLGKTTVSWKVTKFKSVSAMGTLRVLSSANPPQLSLVAVVSKRSGGKSQTYVALGKATGNDLFDDLLGDCDCTETASKGPGGTCPNIEGRILTRRNVSPSRCYAPSSCRYKCAASYTLRQAWAKNLGGCSWVAIPPSIPGCACPFLVATYAPGVLLGHFEKNETRIRQNPRTMFERRRSGDLAYATWESTAWSSNLAMNSTQYDLINFDPFYDHWQSDNWCASVYEYTAHGTADKAVSVWIFVGAGVGGLIALLCVARIVFSAKGSSGQQAMAMSVLDGNDVEHSNTQHAAGDDDDDVPLLEQASPVLLANASAGANPKQAEAEPM